MSTLETIAPPSHPLRNLLHGRGLLGLILVGVVVGAGVFAPLLAPYDPFHQIHGANLQPPSATHWFGTDDVNRDIFSRTLHGIRTDLLVVFVAVPIGAILGSLLGLAAAFWNWADVALQRAFDLVLAFPAIILAIALTMVIGPGILTVALVVIIAEIPAFGRLVRTSVLTVRELPYVESARVAGATDWWLLRRHLLPNSAEPLLVQLTLAMSIGVFIEGAMSFLGLGVAPPVPSLGSLIKEGAGLMHHAPWFAVGPLVVVVLLVLGLLLISQSLAAHSRKR